MEAILSILLSFVFSTCLLGFAYTQIVIPTIRRRLQFHVFKVRDECRRALSRDQISEVEFDYIEDRCNFVISLIKVVDFRLMVRFLSVMRQLSSNEKAKLEIESELVNRSEFVRASTRKIASAVRTATITNSGLWGLLYCILVTLSRWFFFLRRPLIKKYKFNIPETNKFVATFPQSAYEHIKRFPLRPVQI